MTRPPGSRFCGGCGEWCLKGATYDETARELDRREARIRTLEVELGLYREHVAAVEAKLERASLALALAPGFARGRKSRTAVT